MTNPIPYLVVYTDGTTRYFLPETDDESDYDDPLNDTILLYHYSDELDAIKIDGEFTTFPEIDTSIWDLHNHIVCTAYELT